MYTHTHPTRTQEKHKAMAKPASLSGIWQQPRSEGPAALTHAWQVICRSELSPRNTHSATSRHQRPNSTGAESAHCPFMTPLTTALLPTHSCKVHTPGAAYTRRLPAKADTPYTHFERLWVPPAGRKLPPVQGDRQTDTHYLTPSNTQGLPCLRIW